MAFCPSVGRRRGVAAETVNFSIDEDISLAERVFELEEGGHNATVCQKCAGPADGYKNISSNHVMRSGRHMAQFTLVKGSFMLLGLVRPDFVEGEEDAGGSTAHFEREHCFYYTNTGYRHPGQRRWSGLKNAIEGDRIGMVLDLEAGTLAVLKNDVPLGYLVEPISQDLASSHISAGINGKKGYCWSVSMNEYLLRGTFKHMFKQLLPAVVVILHSDWISVCVYRSRYGNCVRLEALPPPPLTLEEFAAAKQRKDAKSAADANRDEASVDGRSALAAARDTRKLGGREGGMLEIDPPPVEDLEPEPEPEAQPEPEPEEE